MLLWRGTAMQRTFIITLKSNKLFLEKFTSCEAYALNNKNNRRYQK